jgi:hypothetical protein
VLDASGGGANGTVSSTNEVAVMTFAPDALAATSGSLVNKPLGNQILTASMNLYKTHNEECKPLILPTMFGRIMHLEGKQDNLQMKVLWALGSGLHVASSDS